MAIDPIGSAKRNELLAEFASTFDELYSSMLALFENEDVLKRNPMFLARICLLKSAMRFLPPQSDPSYVSISETVADIR
jgi:hypothetical protein